VSRGLRSTEKMDIEDIRAGNSNNYQEPIWDFDLSGVDLCGINLAGATLSGGKSFRLQIRKSA